MRRLLPAVFVLLVGLLITVVLAQVDKGVRAEQRQNAVELDANIVADEVQHAIDQAIITAETTFLPMIVRWPSPEEYATSWKFSRASLPGDTAIQTVVRVPAAQLQAFVAGELARNPDFELQFQNLSPPPTGHVITARTSEGLASIIGVDHSSFEGSDDLLDRTQPGSPTFNGRDMRTGLEISPGQLQAGFAHEVPFEDLGTLDAWSWVQIDVMSILNEAISLRPEMNGVTVSSSINPEFVSLGIGPAEAVATASRELSIRDFDVSVQVFSNGTVVGAASPQRTLVLGGSLSLLAALLVYGGTFLSSLIRRLDRSEIQARTDDLTGLPNRRWLLKRFEQENHFGEVAVLLCDLDRFKVVNDSAGHSAGDELLRGVAARLVRLAGSENEVIRFGGDEFIVVCEPVGGQSAMETGTEVAQALVSGMVESFDVGDNTFRTTLSVGVAAGSVSGSDSVDELIRQADTALAKCKQGGRNTFELYNAELREAEIDHLNLEQDLQVSLDRGELEVHYQPLFHEGHGVYSFEALVRWRRGDLLVPPGIFLPVVADMGRMCDLGKIVRRQALAQLAEWSQFEPFRNVTMHVNVDASELVNDEFTELIVAELAEHNISPQKLTLEVTEDKWLDVDGANVDVFEQLADFGVGWAIDDFGTGYSSMHRVLTLHGLTELKVDRSLVQQVLQPAGSAFIAGMVEIGRSLDLTLVAEGVETAEEHEALVKAGVSHFQGFYFGRPADATEAGPTAEHLKSVGPLAL